jgi:hypothetical protein
MNEPLTKGVLCLGLLLLGCARTASPNLVAQLRAEPAMVDFGAISQGGQAQRTLRLINSGSVAVDVDDVVVQGEDGLFIAQAGHAGPHHLLPGSHCDLTVRFHPDGAEEGRNIATGTHQAVLTVATQVPLSVALQATVEPGAVLGLAR